MPMKLGLSCACCGDVCAACIGGTIPPLQITISNFTQVNTPVIDRPCGTNDCTELNKTVALLVSGIAWTPNDSGLSAAMVVKAGTATCDFYYQEELCAGLNTQVSFEIFVTLYVKDSGGVGLYVGYKYAESNTAEGFNGCVTWYEQLGTIAGTGDTVDCTSLYEALTLSTKSSGCLSGSPPVWCDGVLGALLETAP